MQKIKRCKKNDSKNNNKITKDEQKNAVSNLVIITLAGPQIKRALIKPLKSVDLVWRAASTRERQDFYLA